MINFNVTPARGGHRFFINQTIPTDNARQIAVYLPVWIPGSYTRRDFSRFLSHLEAYDSEQKPLPVVMENPSRWRIDVPENCSEIHLSYRVYGRDLSVRGCYLDQWRGIFNPCCACLAVAGREEESQKLTFTFDAFRHNWHIYGNKQKKDGAYYFVDYHHLIDSPLMFGAEVEYFETSAGGVKHLIAITGAEDWDYDGERLTEEVGKICQAAIQLFGELPPAVKEYAFLLFVTANTYGGLEHRSSTMLMSPRSLLASEHAPKGKKYHQLLGLFSHEYFHTWNIKDLKPAIYQPYNLEGEQPSELLWLFEGFTAYFDNWLLVNSGVITKENYFELLADDIASYLNRPGKDVQTLAQSSFEAWTKLYNGGEDGANISTTYYVQGALHALCLDVFLQKATEQQLNLAKVMRKLWQDYRRTGEGMSEEKFISTVSELLPENAREIFKTFLHTYLHTTKELPLAECLDYLGLNLETASLSPNHYLGFETRKTADGYKVISLDENCSAAQNGLAMDDLIIAIDGYQINEEIISRLFITPYDEKDYSHILNVFRDGRLLEIHFYLHPANQKKCKARITENPLKIQRQEKWLTV